MSSNIFTTGIALQPLIQLKNLVMLLVTCVHFVKGGNVCLAQCWIGIFISHLWPTLLIAFNFSICSLNLVKFGLLQALQNVFFNNKPGHFVLNLAQICLQQYLFNVSGKICSSALRTHFYLSLIKYKSSPSLLPIHSYNVSMQYT